MNNLEEARMVFGWVARINRAVTQPYINRKTSLRAINGEESFDAVVTQADIGVSTALLDGGLDGIPGLRSLYPGSFSEEQDTPARNKSLEVIEVDPIDGTGDFINTYLSSRVISPTTLVSKLIRPSISLPFQGAWGIIFEVAHEFGIVSDGEEILLLSFSAEGEICEVPHKRMQPKWKKGDPIFINQRVCYPQLALHGPFMNFLRKNGMDVRLVPSGGCGITQLQVFRNFIEPSGPGAEAFEAMPPLSVSFFAQPDTKTWDLDSAEVIADALNLPRRTDVFGGRLSENASAPTFAEMYRLKGQMLSTNMLIQRQLCALAVEFSDRNPDCPLLAKDYEYKDAILAASR